MGGQTSSGGDVSPPPKANKGRGLLCWAIFGVFLLFFIIMTSVFTRPQSYSGANPIDYLAGEDKTLYKGLGKVFFTPTTQKMSAMAQFQLGLQLLHVFWYDKAIMHFQQARQLDPQLAMAYWGEAMANKQALWQFENVTAAQAVLAQMAKYKVAAKTPREQSYIDAVKVLFADGQDLQSREQMYSDAMASTWQQFQDDPDACAFYSLSLLGQLHSVGQYLSADEADQVRSTADDQLGDCLSYPDFEGHAGLLHYQVNLYDQGRVDEAVKGMAPADNLAVLARASSHAVHMRGHIYARLGNWSVVVAANKDAVAASDSFCAATKGGGDVCDADNRFHALEWQLYGRTQSCAFAQALPLLSRMQTVTMARNSSGAYVQWLYRMYSHMQLQSMLSLGSIALYPKDNTASFTVPPLYTGAQISDAEDIGDHFSPPHAEAHALLARIYSLTYNRTAAAMSAAPLQATLSRLVTVVAGVVAQSNAANGTDAFKALSEMASLLTTVQLQAQALIIANDCASNRNASTCSAWRPLMDQALALHSTFYDSPTLPTLKIAPTPEWYGMLLLFTKQDAPAAAAAAALFDTCLQQLPGRMPCVLGRARAARAAGDMDNARKFYKAFATQCVGGDAKFAPIAEARMALMSPPPPKKSSGRLLRSA